MNADYRYPALDRQANEEPSPVPESSDTETRRVFVREPGWRVALKVGSERSFCYMMAPGQNFYHRLLDGEIYVYQGDERLCLACAERRGLLTFEPKRLRTPMRSSEVDVHPDILGPDFDLKYLPGDEG